MRILRLALLFCAALLLVSELHAQSACGERIRNVIWRTLDKDILSGPWDCRKVMELKPIQLGPKKGFVVSGYGPPLCGATGNCSTWVVVINTGRPRLILDAGSVIERVEVTKRPRFQYPDLSFRGRMGIAEHYIGRYRFDGRRYRLIQCLNEVYSTDGKRSVVKAKRGFCGIGN